MASPQKPIPEASMESMPIQEPTMTNRSIPQIGIPENTVSIGGQ